MSRYVSPRVAHAAVDAASPYAYRLPPDTFLSRRDPGFYIGAVPARGHKFSPEVLQQTVTSLVKMLASAKAAADKIVEDTPGFLARSSMREWATNFKQITEGMIIRLITPTASGFYSWEVTPKLIKDVADYIDQETKDMRQSAYDLLSISGAFKQIYQAVLNAAAEGLKMAADKALEVAEEIADKAVQKPLSALLVGGAAITALALYFYIKK